MIQLSDYKNIHCIGIGGVGVSAIAEILLSRGYRVSGSDMKQSEITDRLKQHGVKIYIGHRAENVEDADLIVYSAAIAEENPEIIRAREKNLPLASRAEVLGTLDGRLREQHRHQRHPWKDYDYLYGFFDSAAGGAGTDRSW